MGKIAALNFWLFMFHNILRHHVLRNRMRMSNGGKRWTMKSVQEIRNSWWCRKNYNEFRKSQKLQVVPHKEQKITGADCRRLFHSFVSALFIGKRKYYSLPENRGVNGKMPPGSHTYLSISRVLSIDNSLLQQILFSLPEGWSGIYVWKMTKFTIIRHLSYKLNKVSNGLGILTPEEKHERWSSSTRICPKMSLSLENIAGRQKLYLPSEKYY